MSTLAAVLTTYALLSISATGTYVLIRRSSGRESTRDRIVREAHERAAAARGADELELLYNLPAYRDLGLDAGYERLRNAINEHREGDS